MPARARRAPLPAAPALVLLLVLVLVLLPARPAGALVYAPPVHAPVVDGFRPPTHAYGAGNRGLEYRTDPGRPARAVADGVVAFAGPVAGRLVVSVVHPDGLRSALTGLASVHVALGAQVRRGRTLGTTGSLLHLGVRRGDEYLDPAALFVASGGGVHLVPLDGGAARASRLGAERRLDVVRCPPACRPGTSG